MTLSLSSARLRLREWRPSDLEPFAAMGADPRVMEFFPRLLTREQAEAFIHRANESLAVRRFGLWALEVTATQDFIGLIGLAEPGFEAAFTPCIEIGWRLKFDAWGQGYALEGAQRVLDYAWDGLGLVELVSFTSAGNLRSRKLMERLGMQRDLDADFEHPLIETGHPLRPHVLYRKRRPGSVPPTENR